LEVVFLVLSLCFLGETLDLLHKNPNRRNINFYDCEKNNEEKYENTMQN
jgi:hypothetical protein